MTSRKKVTAKVYVFFNDPRRCILYSYFYNTFILTLVTFYGFKYELKNRYLIDFQHLNLFSIHSFFSKYDFVQHLFSALPDFTNTIDDITCTLLNEFQRHKNHFAFKFSEYPNKIVWLNIRYKTNIMKHLIKLSLD